MKTEWERVKDYNATPECVHCTIVDGLLTEVEITCDNHIYRVYVGNEHGTEQLQLERTKYE